MTRARAVYTLDVGVICTDRHGPADRHWGSRTAVRKALHAAGFRWSSEQGFYVNEDRSQWAKIVVLAPPDGGEIGWFWYDKATGR